MFCILGNQTGMCVLILCSIAQVLTVMCRITVCVGEKDVCKIVSVLELGRVQYRKKIHAGSNRCPF